MTIDVSSLGSGHGRLSPFEKVDIKFEGMNFVSSEALFKSLLILDKSKLKEFGDLDRDECVHKFYLSKYPKIDDLNYKIKAMVIAEYLKYTQHPDLKEELLNTGDEEIVYNAFFEDRNWFTVNGVGSNLYGKTIMAIRDMLREGRTIDASLDRL